MLHLSQTGFYALNAILYVAHAKGQLVKIKDIALQNDISESLLRRIIADLEKGNILTTIRGRSGGVTLAREIHKISLYDIFKSVGEDLGIRDCTKGYRCENREECQTSDILNNLQKGFTSLLRIHTLDKLIK